MEDNSFEAANASILLDSLYSDNCQKVGLCISLAWLKLKAEAVDDN